jgi:YHS domain-containing protein
MANFTNYLVSLFPFDCQREIFYNGEVIKEYKMKSTKMSGSIVLLAALLIIGTVSVIGCKKQSSPSPAPAASESQAQPAAAAAVEQTICPVMGGPVNKDIFVEYQGKKVYFCCEQCKAEFNKEPEKYLPKLPQFAK